MKKILTALLLPAALICFNTNINAQLRNIVQHAKDKTADKVNEQVDKSIDNSSNNSNQNNSTQNNTDNNSTNTQADNNNTGSQNQTTSSEATPVSVTAYQNYDFRAGDKIIFEDNFVTDQDGEFPAHWDLTSGQAVVNKITGIPAFLLTDGNYCRVHPLMKTDAYLTDNYSVEYDTYVTPQAYGLMIFFKTADDDMSVHITSEGAQWSHSNANSLSGSNPSAIQYDNFFNKWHHIAIAYKNDQMKVYVDQYRVLTIPHCNFKATSVECAGIGDQNNPIIFKDFKIADGASMNMLDKIMTDGKFVTHGINFDVNKATLKPESMGVIGDVVKYMQANASLKLEIDGHTDSDGSDAANLTLSQQRADAVKTAMVAAGIDASRLTTKGFGESKPLGTNDTPEGKAMNRRVEFVKI